jgi:hypothetical protein
MNGKRNTPVCAAQRLAPRCGKYIHFCETNSSSVLLEYQSKYFFYP